MSSIGVSSMPTSNTMNTDNDPDSRKSAAAATTPTAAPSEPETKKSFPTANVANDHRGQAVNAHGNCLPTDSQHSTTYKQSSQQEKSQRKQEPPMMEHEQEPTAPPSTSVSEPTTAKDGQQAEDATTEQKRAAVPASGTIDVLLGRGVPIQRNRGNIRMHRIVDMYRDQYQVANRADKTVIVRAVIHKIRDGGARFLKRSEDGTLWVEVEDESVYEKISHALRGNGSSRRDPSSTESSSRSAKEKASALTAHSQRKKDRHGDPPAPTVSTATSSSISNSSKNTSNGTATTSASTEWRPSNPPSALGPSIPVPVQSNNHFSALTNGALGGSAAGTNDLLAALLPGPSQASSLSGATAAAGSTYTAENFVVARLLQNQLARQLEQERLQQLLASSSISPSAPVLDFLQARAIGSFAQQQPLNYANLSQLLQGNSVANQSSLLGMSQSRPSVDPQLASLLLAATNQGNAASSPAVAHTGGNLTGSLGQLLQQQQQEQQARLQLMRQAETELAMRGLAPVPSMIGGETNPTQATTDPLALLLALLMGQSSTQSQGQPPAPTRK